ncbi:Putative ciliary rootlet coiled-coil protein 2 [Larimichthys crocea]|uniref:Uncharacterized protein n=1 Tax=Larimichthys crocea TaxID=215358 RepID=A0ACD3RMI1_LARCR|nr:Putative ciliary rootlet coiled-coil protein 2 [Larimichthys crocea]
MIINPSESMASVLPWKHPSQHSVTVATARKRVVTLAGDSFAMTSQREQGAHSPRLEAVIQKLEESLLNSDGSSGERSLTLRGDGQESSVTPTPVSTRIRQIITRNLAEQPTGESSQVSEPEESRALREQLSPGQMDRDQPRVKQGSLTERLDQIMQAAVDSDQDSVSPWIAAEHGESLQAKAAGLPGGPEETSPTCSEASNQGSSVQEEVWGTRRAGAGEDLGV